MKFVIRNFSILANLSELLLSSLFFDFKGWVSPHARVLSQEVFSRVLRHFNEPVDQCLILWVVVQVVLSCFEIVKLVHNIVILRHLRKSELILENLFGVHFQFWLRAALCLQLSEHLSCLFPIIYLESLLEHLPLVIHFFYDFTRFFLLLCLNFGESSLFLFFLRLLLLNKALRPRFNIGKMKVVGSVPDFTVCRMRILLLQFKLLKVVCHFVKVVILFLFFWLCFFSLVCFFCYLLFGLKPAPIFS